MSRTNHLIVLILLIPGIMLSGCINSDSSPDSDNQQTTTDNTSSILAKNNAILTDTEIESLENETKELDRLIESMDTDENITFEGI
ncbi:conserved hypothetical protein [Methanohalobium evestigatum Z-7303]|uniref:Uncharacterized protein n=1 Tax=Methanohalobium evestigatum (strain ATCC BAA-1072 / DSM 3721 / NBRC 107634 / OCM 161 / Z-7303) TaxID=644295 RepID=D7E8X1_METEZ|nr:hypothetical protein [Methanohalobium evestigatum]ADI73792.1 conserved hypothetical protein [Methanohalobium evestigatum Z-7303]